MPEIERAQALDRTSSPLGGKLDEYLWITAWDLHTTVAVSSPVMLGTVTKQTILRVEAIVKPLGMHRDDTPAAIRHKLLMAYECAICIIEQMGVEWDRYPELTFSGQANRFDGPPRLLTEARVDLWMVVTNA
jgi:hypothetical protein